MTRYTTTDVLICGAGVTGLTLAIELARHGVSFRLIEKRTTPFIGSRGKGIQPRTQEIFEDLGRGHHRSLFDRRGWRRKLCQKEIRRQLFRPYVGNPCACG